MFLQVWRHLGVQIWCAVIRHLGSISEVVGRGWVAHLSVSDPSPRELAEANSDALDIEPICNLVDSVL